VSTVNGFRLWQVTQGCLRNGMQSVITQWFLCGFSFLALFSWGVAVTFMKYALNIQYDGLGKHYCIYQHSASDARCSLIFLWLIFIRPRYLSICQSAPTLNRWQAFLRTIINQPARQSAGSSYGG
jgi:hypothetical protein